MCVCYVPFETQRQPNVVNLNPLQGRQLGETTSLKSSVFPQSLWSRSVMNIVLENSSCCSEVMNKNELDDRMFIARLTSTHLIYKHCGFGIWVNFDALLCRIIFLASFCTCKICLKICMIWSLNVICQFSVTRGLQYCGNLMLDLFLSKQFDFECNSSRLTHFTRIELTFFLKLLFFHRLPADVMKEQWSQKQPNNSCSIIFQSKKKIRQS